MIRIYRGHAISRLFPSGMYEAYIGGRFMRADTLAGIKATIREQAA